MTLHDTIQADAASVFCNLDDFAETVTYQPEGGTPRVISVVVNRDQSSPYGADEQSELPYLTFQVVNDGTLGITSSGLKEGRDKILVATTIGGTPKARVITALLGHDEGMLELECR